MFKIITVTDPLTESNCYILIEEEHCVVIDPGEAVKTPETLRKRGLEPELILLTHEHCDHMGGLAELRRRYPEARFLATERCDEGIRSTKLNMSGIMGAYLYFRGKPDIHYDSYAITREPDGYRASVNDGEPQAIDGAVVEALARAVEEYDLARWDGFRESREFVLDGESFWLELRLTDGSHISASGDNAFPEGYFPAISAIQDILDGAGLG